MTTASATAKPTATDTPPLPTPMIVAHKPTVTLAIPFHGGNETDITAWVTARTKAAEQDKAAKAAAAKEAASKDAPHSAPAAKDAKDAKSGEAKKTMTLQTARGSQTVEAGDWVLIGVDGQPYALTADQFDASYAHLD